MSANNKIFVTADQIRESVLKNNIKAWLPWDCCMCGVRHGYYFFQCAEHEVMRNASCGCARSLPYPSSWEDIADAINIQSNENIARDLMAGLGIK